MQAGRPTLGKALARLAAAALPLGLASPGHAAASLDLLSSETLSLAGDMRLVAADGERSWVDGGFGKLRSSGDGQGDWHVRPQLGNVDLVWQPRFGWALSGTVTGTLQGGEKTQVGISEAFLTVKPMQGGRVRLSARAGLIWTPISLEHGGADWHVTDTITPSAINSWIGEEVRPLAIELKADLSLGSHKLAATAALFAANDTAGALLTFRGWALHDRRTLVGHRQPLPPLSEEFEYYQPPFTHPLLDVGPGFAKRPGYYLKLAWSPPLPIRLELFRYDNRADPEAVNEDLEWGWRTRFNHFGAIVELGTGTELRVQAITGRALMGFKEADGIWVDSRFRSAFALLTHHWGKLGVAGRIEAFGTRQRGSLVTGEDSEQGWAGTIAAQREIVPHLTGIVELLHVSSERDARERLGLQPRQNQTQVQVDLRVRW
jgi:hypothetical protein